MTVTPPAIPVISLKAGPGQLSEAILDACTGIGFFYLTDIPIDPNLVESAWSASEELFLDRSDEAMKGKQASRDRTNNVGYTAIREEKLQLTKKNSNKKSGVESSDGEVAPVTLEDLKESFYIAKLTKNNSNDMQQVLPSVLQNRREDLDKLFQGCEGICATLMKALAAALGLSQDYFTSQHHSQLDRLRLIHYPPAPLSKEGKGSEHEIRAGSHSDYGTVTLLFQRGVAGLQVLQQKNKNKKTAAAQQDTDEEEEEVWLDIEPRKGAIVVNVGDALEFWTSGVFRSTQHRVVMPRTTEETVSRFSMAYFCQPDSDALLAPLENVKPIKPIDVPSREDYEDVLRRKGIDLHVKHLTGGQHLQSRLQSTYSST